MFLGSLSAADVETQMLLVQLGFGWKIPRNLAVRFVSLETQGQRVSFACALLLSLFFGVIGPFCWNEYGSPTVKVRRNSREL